MTIIIGGGQSILAPACDFQRRDVDVLILDAGTRHTRQLR
jgi:cation diffusion facilitator CzcD-associated flavoprotein CzcO